MESKSEGSVVDDKFMEDNLEDLLMEMENEAGEGDELPQKALSDSSSVVILGMEDGFNNDDVDYEEGLCCMTGGDDDFE